MSAGGERAGGGGAEVGGGGPGVGLSVTLRLRIGAHDAHYAGELVDGAKCLQLFGDVATELLIRLDGDEGLFRAYDAVEFLAPVRAGDYLEVQGTITAIGRSSRKMRFEARKVIENVRGVPGVAPSAANVLDPPIVVCRASGTCVTPVECQRGPGGGGPGGRGPSGRGGGSGPPTKEGAT
jgi:3-keto-5-aminohexanoate cleavage enzyme